MPWGTSDDKINKRPHIKSIKNTWEEKVSRRSGAESFSRAGRDYSDVYIEDLRREIALRGYHSVRAGEQRDSSADQYRLPSDAVIQQTGPEDGRGPPVHDTERALLG